MVHRQKNFFIIGGVMGWESILDQKPDNLPWEGLVPVKNLHYIYKTEILDKMGDSDEVLNASKDFRVFIQQLVDRGVKYIPQLCVNGEIEKIKKELSLF